MNVAKLCHHDFSEELSALLYHLKYNLIFSCSMHNKSLISVMFSENMNIALMTPSTICGTLRGAGTPGWEHDTPAW